jgi:hypothetical protein
MPKAFFEIVRETVAYGVMEGHYPIQDYKKSLGAYPTRRAARNALVAAGATEAAAHGLVIDPWFLPRVSGTHDYTGNGLRLIPPAEADKPSGDRRWAARLTVRKIGAN